MELIKLLVFAAALSFAVTPASADLYTWNTTTNVTAGNGSSVGCPGTTKCMTTFTSTSGAKTLTVRAYSTPNYNNGTAPNAGSYNTSGNWVGANIAVFSANGIGVRNLNSSDGASETSSPEHALDNNGVRDIVVYDFGSAGWDPTSLALGFKSNDSDVNAWVGGGSAVIDFSTVSFSTLAGLGFSNITPNIGATGGSNLPLTSQTITGSATGRYLVLTGAVGALADGNFDNFKVSSLSANVPVPGSLLLLGLGLVILTFVRARPLPRRSAVSC